MSVLSEGTVDNHALPHRCGFLGETGEAFSHIASGVSSLVTAVAVVIGGIWAYRKFIQGRTFKPRSSAKLSAQWHVLPAVGHVLHVRICVTNIGASSLILVPRGTGLAISFPAASQTSAAHRRTDKWWPDIRWEKVPLLEGGVQARTFVILKDHQWVEPGETVFDDLLLNLGRDPTIALVEAELVWRLPRWWWKDKEVCDFLGQIVPPEAAIGDNKPNAVGHDETEVG
jgi:hypothetical protein